MPFYRCMMRGEDFPGELIGSTGDFGFYTTRWVQALTAWRAELKAVEMIRKELKGKMPQGLPPPTRARIHREEVEKIDKLPRFRGGGAVWYRQEDEPRPLASERVRDRLEARSGRTY